MERSSNVSVLYISICLLFKCLCADLQYSERSVLVSSLLPLVMVMVVVTSIIMLMMM